MILSRKDISKVTSSTSKELVRSLFLNLILNLLLYLGHLIIARRLPRDDYAVFTVVVSFVSLMALFADLGLTLLFVRRFAAAETLAATGKVDERGELLGSMLALRLGMAVAVSYVVLVITPLLGYSVGTRHLMMIMLVTLFISSRLLVVRSVGEAFLRGHNKYHLVAFFAAVDALVFFGLLYFYSGKILNLEGAVWIYSLCHIPGFLLLGGLIFRDARSIGFHVRVRFATVRSMIREGLPLILSTAFLTIHSQADQLLIDKLSSSKEVSAYGAGLRILSAIIFLPSVFTAVIGPLVTQATITQDFDKIRFTIDRALRLLLVCALFIAIALSLSSTFVVNILFGSNKYSDASPLAMIFGWSFIPICYGAFVNDIAISEGRLWIPALYTSIIMAISISCDIILIPLYGALGAGIAKGIAVTIGAIVLLSISERFHVLDHRKIFKLLLQLGGVVLCSFGIGYILTSLHTEVFLQFCIVVLTFFITVVLVFKIISLNEIRMFVPDFFIKANLRKN